MKSAFWARRAHKWIGLIIGVQALLWMISGVYMTVISLEIIHGDHLAHTHSEPLDPSAVRVDQSDLAERYPGLTSLRMKRLLDMEVYELHQGKRTSLIDAASGKQVSPLTEATVLALAKATYQGDAEVDRAEWITQAPQEVATRAVPIWAVHFSDWGRTTLYFSPHTGDLLARRHSLWRAFDFLWMLHIMDYETRSDVNNNLLRVAAATGLVFALCGIWLLFYSFQRRAKA